MTGTTTNQEDDASRSGEPTVASAVLAEFFDALKAADGFTEAAPKLRALVLDDGVFWEAVLRAALFGDAA